MKQETKTKQIPFFEELFYLLGQLNYSFTNTESLLIHVIAGLARVNKETASIIFLTLNTTRARLSLVERLSKSKELKKSLRLEILDLTKSMANIIKIKNKYNHCIYSFDNESGQAATILMRIFDKKDEIKYGKLDHIDENELKQLKEAIKDISGLNVKIWAFLKRNEFPI